MRIAVTGAKGFIGKRFIELYKQEFTRVKSLSSENAPLNNFELIETQLSNIDVLVHTAFDHYYQYNIVGLEYFIKACRNKGVKKIVFLSTFAVYNPDIGGKVCEDSAYSFYNDPYTREKIKLERMLGSLYDIQVIILQPTIVYGLGGSWSNYAVNACKHKKLNLPARGERVCNIVYVDDVAQAIFKAVKVQGISFGKFIISGEERISWSDFYQLHHQLLIESNFDSGLTIGLARNLQFHENFITNMIFFLWFRTKLHFFFDLFIKEIKKLREKKYPFKEKRERINFFQLFQLDVINKEFTPVGMTKKMHNIDFDVMIDKSRNDLDYQPVFNVQKAKQHMLEKFDILAK